MDEACFNLISVYSLALRQHSASWFISYIKMLISDIPQVDKRRGVYHLLLGSWGFQSQGKVVMHIFKKKKPPLQMNLKIHHKVVFAVVQSLSYVWLFVTPWTTQHTRLPCPSLSPGICSNSHPLSWWCHPTISSFVALFSSCPQSFPVWGKWFLGLNRSELLF